MAAVKGHMAEAWERYLNKVMPPSASETQVDETRKAFYSGAAALLAQIMLYLGPDEEPTDADMAMMDGIHEELVAFARSQGG